MPTQHTVFSFKFYELSDKAKDVARDWFREFALDYDWYDSIYEDAANVGLKITGFDLGRAQKVEGKFTQDASAVAKAIRNDHGKGTDTHALAEAFLDETDGEPTGDQEFQFLIDLRQAYWHMLNREAEYITSEECVDESILANEYDFTGSGKRFRG